MSCNPKIVSTCLDHAKDCTWPLQTVLDACPWTHTTRRPPCLASSWVVALAYGLLCLLACCDSCEGNVDPNQGSASYYLVEPSVCRTMPLQAASPLLDLCSLVPSFTTGGLSALPVPPPASECCTRTGLLHVSLHLSSANSNSSPSALIAAHACLQLPPTAEHTPSRHVSSTR